MLQKLLQFEGVREIDREHQKLITGTMGITCPDGTYPYNWNGYSGCCANPIDGSPCGRRDCLVHIDACDTDPS
ncbi:hypothetical protein LS482_11995 [Sinomicrobium kalidii]|uniref:hypothetical protein n=1 Tax=Sinomicrobium kalidii TaxID=2900738 RepID=UPI001E4D118A|nr:hypothetical protein [Sinomicrobium kalidii]UGU14427.1 hypothetical protein LS482_11995 [Sinomicrobium kalidii]